MAKKMNLATALHKAPGRRSQGESPSLTTEPTIETMIKLADETIQKGDSTTQATTLSVFPAVGRFFSNAVYGTFYYATYGIVFTSVMVTHWIPTHNAMGHGVQDGAAAAKKAFQTWQAPNVAEQVPSEQDLGNAGEHLATA